MPRVKVKKQSTFIDMTAMSDVTVLLLTFFMLTSTFVQKEPVQVVTPKSVSEIKIPETNILQILVDTNGKMFMSLDNQGDRVNVLRNVGDEYGVTFTDAEISSFRLLPSFGVPVKDMKAFLNQKSEVQDEILKGKVAEISAGIPCDSINNELKVWVKQARGVNPDIRIAIKAASQTPYPVIKQLMSSLQDIRENRYNLITSLKTVQADEH